jgi:hypothetical protein
VGIGGTITGELAANLPCVGNGGTMIGLAAANPTAVTKTEVNTAKRTRGDMKTIMDLLL